MNGVFPDAGLVYSMRWILLPSTDKSLLLTNVGITLTLSLIKSVIFIIPPSELGCTRRLRLDSTITSVAFKDFLPFCESSTVAKKHVLTICRYIDEVSFRFCYTYGQNHTNGYTSPNKTLKRRLAGL